MEQYKKVLTKLKELKITYDLVEHPPALTKEDADSYIEGKDGVRTKTLFLCNHKKTKFYLIVMDEDKRLNIKKLNELFNEKNIHFASEELLKSKLGLTPGIVSLFGLLNNIEHDVKIYFDKEMLNEDIITFTANDNSKTIFINKENMFKFLKLINYDYNIIDL